ncbi:hypothetical protein SGPA1_20842 [Streptomyces misionensis JCM 4497]
MSYDPFRHRRPSPAGARSPP